VPPLVAGSGIEFEDRGMRALKGVPGEWRLSAVKTQADPRRSGWIPGGTPSVTLDKPLAK
jgi:hypothetical protein